jgi:hypothetical protein
MNHSESFGHVPTIAIDGCQEKQDEKHYGYLLGYDLRHCAKKAIDSKTIYSLKASYLNI